MSGQPWPHRRGETIDPLREAFAGGRGIRLLGDPRQLAQAVAQSAVRGSFIGGREAGDKATPIAAPASSSWVSRDFPEPASPTIVAVRPAPRAAPSSASLRRASSSSRPASGSRVGMSARRPTWRPTRYGTTGARLPFGVNDSRASLANSTAERPRTSAVASSSPGAARAARRAARLVVSPIAVYVRRCAAPTSPAKTGPRLTPARRRSRPASGDRQDLAERRGASAPRRPRSSRCAGRHEQRRAVRGHVRAEQRHAVRSALAAAAR